MNKHASSGQRELGGSAARELKACLNVCELQSADDSSLTRRDLTAKLKLVLSFPIPPLPWSAATRSNTEAEEGGVKQSGEVHRSFAHNNKTLIVACKCT